MTSNYFGVLFSNACGWQYFLQCSLVWPLSSKNVKCDCLLFYSYKRQFLEEHNYRRHIRRRWPIPWILKCHYYCRSFGPDNRRPYSYECIIFINQFVFDSRPEWQPFLIIQLAMNPTPPPTHRYIHSSTLWPHDVHSNGWVNKSIFWHKWR